MERKSNEIHKHITEFNPDVMLLDEGMHQDFHCHIEQFNAGYGYENFNDFICDEAIEYKNNGDGVTYIVWNVSTDDEGNEINRELVSYYTLAATAIPFEDRIRNEEDEFQRTGEKYNIEICGISAIEIKMFAVSIKYQDVFFEYDGDDLPVAAWIMKNIIDYVNTILNEVVGLKAIFLHSLPKAEKFYNANGFNPVAVNMQPLHCVDSEYKAMYLTLKEVHMNYDD